MDAVLLLLGYLGYAGLKLVGYTLAARGLRSLLGRPDVRVWRVGLIRRSSSTCRSSSGRRRSSPRFVSPPLTRHRFARVIV
jgi:hypothetical protein